MIPDHQKRRIDRMNEIDSMTPEMRDLVNEFGFHVVKTLRDCGVTKPSRIKHCVDEILKELSPVRGSSSYQGKKERSLVEKGMAA